MKPNHIWLFLTAFALSAGCNGDSPKQREAAVRPSSDAGVSDTNRVKLVTSKGDIVIEVHPEWAPLGAARFKKLVEEKFYDDCRFFRVIPDFMAQVGMNGDPSVHAEWGDNNIQDDPRRAGISNLEGYVTFAKTNRPNTRSTQFFINYGNNARLDMDGFTPFGKVVEGMDVAKSINAQYREQPNQGLIARRGNPYLIEQFPNLDYIKTARFVEGGE